MKSIRKNIFVGVFAILLVSLFIKGNTVMADSNDDFMMENGVDCYQDGKDFTLDNVITEYNGAQEKVIIPDGVNGIDGYAFSNDNCDTITSIYIPATVTYIGEEAFKCKNLKEIIVDPNNKVYSSIDGSLYNKEQTILEYCPTGISGTFIIPDTVKTIKILAFEDGSSVRKITTIKIPASVSDLDENGLSGFAFLYTPFNFKSLQNIVVDSGNTKFSSSDGVLYNKKQTTLMRYPMGKNKMVAIPKTVTTIDKGAFSMCYFKEFKVPSTIKTIKSGAFAYLNEGKEALSVTLPKSIRTIEDRAFNVSRITKVIFSEGIKELPACLFSSNDTITDVTIPKSVTKISKDLFEKYNDKITIHGYKGSYAQKYAKKYKMKFSVIK